MSKRACLDAVRLKLRPLSGTIAMQNLDVRWGCKIPPEGLHTLAGLTQLTALDASHTGIYNIMPPCLWVPNGADGVLGNLSCPTGTYVS